ncbi:MAG: alpha/beta hydrolase [Myxococcota bacterium]
MVALAPRFARVPRFGLRRQLVGSLLRTAANGLTDRDPVQLRETLDRLARWAPAPAGVDQQVGILGGQKAVWTTPRALRSKETILHLHGGGYATCSLATHRGMLADLARATGRQVVAVEYRKAPEHAFPIPVDDCVRAYRALHRRHSNLVLSGDSAGGALACAVVQRVRGTWTRLPRALVLLSPWADLRCTGRDTGVDYVKPDALARFASYYLQGADPDHPEASPVNANFEGFPPMLIQAGGAELIRPGIERMARRARQARVPVRFEMWDGMFHAWHGFSAFVPEAKEAFRAIGTYLDES